MSNIGGWEQEDLISNIQFSARILKHCTSQPDSSHIYSFIKHIHTIQVSENRQQPHL